MEGDGINCEAVAKAIKDAFPKIPIIALSGREGFKIAGADYQVSSYEPENLLALARELLGDPR